jgi:hypothetical protein
MRAEPQSATSLAARLHVLHIDDLRVRIGFAINDDFVAPLFGARDV